VIVGVQHSFAIESAITAAFRSYSQRALGYFVVYIQGRSYGVREPDASMLGCSFEEVKERLRTRGTHRTPQLTHQSAAAIVEAFLDALYRETTRDSYFGMTTSEFISVIHAGKIQWAPDGDEAFDDGSYILQFDEGDKVRLIAFRNSEWPEEVANSVVEQWIDVDIFYSVLSEWVEQFNAEWLIQIREVKPKAGTI